MGARYRDVVVRSPVLTTDAAGLVLLGDAAHAMSPQLGLGASFALADAWALATCLRRRPNDLAGALRAYASSRAAHVRYYTWCSRLLTPVFQSDLVPIGWARDALMEPFARIPWVRGQFCHDLHGRTHLSPGRSGDHRAKSPARRRRGSIAAMAERPWDFIIVGGGIGRLRARQPPERGSRRPASSCSRRAGPTIASTSSSTCRRR